MKKLLALCGFLLGIFTLNAQVNDLARSQAELGRDGSFINEATSAGLMEVELGKLAQQKGSSQQVKNFGRMMERDHSASNRKLQSISQKMGLTPLTEMLDKHKDHVEKIKDKSGFEFDKEYMDLMVEDHEEDIKEFEEAIAEVNNSELKDWVSTTLSVLKDHASQAKHIQENLKESEQ